MDTTGESEDSAPTTKWTKPTKLYAAPKKVFLFVKRQWAGAQIDKSLIA